ncbi:hypothetical protein [Spirosoma jeollabukense]
MTLVGEQVRVMAWSEPLLPVQPADTNARSSGTKRPRIPVVADPVRADQG